MTGRLVGVLAGLALLAASGAAAGPTATRTPHRLGPQAFVKQLVTQIVRDDYARSWLTLYPAHQAAAQRWEFVYCELKTPIPGAIVSLRILRVADVPISVPGVGERPGKAVTFRVVLRGVGTVAVTHTSHIVRVNERWRWILTPERYGLYKSDACGETGPTA